MLENSFQMLGQTQAVHSIKGAYTYRCDRKQTFSYIINIMAFQCDPSSQICLFLGFSAGFSKMCPIPPTQKNMSALYFGRDNEPCLRYDSANLLIPFLRDEVSSLDNSGPL